MSSPSHALKIGLIGASIEASRSPAMHEIEAAALGLDLSYVRIDLKARGVGADALPQILAEAQGAGFSGVNITHPCKQAVIPLLDELSDEAAMIGAVNTVVFKEGRRLGYNTDAGGFRENFRRNMPSAPLGRVVQLGAGGAGAATAHAMLQLGTKHLTLIDADAERARGLAEKMASRFGAGRASAAADLATVVTSAHGLVHATPTGTADHPGLPLPAELLRPDLWVAEVVYFPLETALLTAARRIGARTVDGGGMAVLQAAKAFELFTGVAPDIDRMLRQFASA